MSFRLFPHVVQMLISDVTRRTEGSFVLLDWFRYGSTKVVDKFGWHNFFIVQENNELLIKTQHLSKVSLWRKIAIIISRPKYRPSTSQQRRQHHLVSQYWFNTCSRLKLWLGWTYHRKDSTRKFPSIWNA